MMPEDDSTLTIPRDVIDPIIQAKISAAVTSALSDKSALLDKIVARVLTQKVYRSGAIDNYPCESSQTYIEWLMDESLRDAVRNALADAMVHNSNVIRDGIVKQLRNHRSPLAKQLAQGMVNALTSEPTLKYRIDITCEGR